MRNVLKIFEICSQPDPLVMELEYPFHLVLFSLIQSQNHTPLFFRVPYYVRNVMNKILHLFSTGSIGFGTGTTSSLSFFFMNSS